MSISFEDSLKKELENNVAVASIATINIDDVGIAPASIMTLDETGGIAAYAISIHYLDESPIRIENYDSVSDIPYYAKSLAFPANSFTKDELVDLSRFPYIESVSFGKGSFPNARSFKAVNCPTLKRIVIEDSAFANTSVFEVEQTSEMV